MQQRLQQSPAMGGHRTAVGLNRAWRVRVSIWMAVLALLPALSVYADSYQMGDLELPLEKRVMGQAWTLHGAGKLKLGFVIPVYVAALYLRDVDDIDLLSQGAPMMLEIHYFQDIDKKHMMEAAEKCLQQTLTERERVAVAERVDQLHEVYLDTVPKGSVYTLLFQPGQGTYVLLNGSTVLQIPGSDFARAYFSIWLGPHPASKSVKKHLLKPVKRRS